MQMHVLSRHAERVPHHPSIQQLHQVATPIPKRMRLFPPQYATQKPLRQLTQRISPLANHSTPRNATVFRSAAALPSERTHQTTRTMSSITLASLQYISREALASEFSPTSSLPANIAVVDVRDSDHIGGHIAGSTWVPSSTLDYKVPELVRTLQDKEVVVFHCALSQQRGPSAALRYIREKERLDALGEGVESEGVVREEGAGGEGEKKGEGAEAKEGKRQKVYVLKGGFTEWQEKYGEDKTLTEGYQKDIWEFGY